MATTEHMGGSVSLRRSGSLSLRRQHTTLYTPPSGKVAYSAFLPTSTALVFEQWTSTSDILGDTEIFYGTPGKGFLEWVDVASKTAHALDNLNGVGYLTTNSTHTDDAILNFGPTVNPVPSGGYAWVVFTSRRIYGNVATQGSLPERSAKLQRHHWHHHQEAVGRSDRSERATGNRSQPSRVLHSRPGAVRRQLTWLLDRRSVPRQWHDLRKW